MNIWTSKSIELANQRDYLDQLFKVYPMSTNLNREITKTDEIELRNFIQNRNNTELIKFLLEQVKNKKLVFPFKDSYVRYLFNDFSAIERNPQTVNRLAGKIYSMGADETLKAMIRPKETNQQIGPLFKNWIDKGVFGVRVVSDAKEFISSNENIIFNSGDGAMVQLARNYLGYNRIREKGLDFIAKFNGKYVLGEAKFISDLGGNQNNQLDDAIGTMRSNMNIIDSEVIAIAIVDGTPYIRNNGKQHKILTSASDNEVIISSLLLSDYLFSL